MIFVWLYRLFPSVSAITIVQSDTVIRVASGGFPTVLALEVSIS